MGTHHRRDPWFRMMIGVFDHPKIAVLDDSAIVAWQILIDYSAAHKTDGLVPRVWAARARGPKPLKAIVDAGLVEPAEDAAFVRVRDFLDWQTSREKAETTSAARKRAGASGGRKSPGEGRPDP